MVSSSSSSEEEKSTTSNSNNNNSSILSTIFNKIGSTTSIVVAGTFYIVLCYERNAFMFSFFIGAISNGILSKVLKKILKQERPAELDTSSMDLAPSDNGMPSSHAMSLGFICTFTALSIPYTTIPLIIYAIISLIYRVQTNLHSLEQIVVGAILGTANGAIWWHLCTGTNNPLGINVVDWISSTPIINDQGLLPWYLLSVPALVGAAVVGSVERRISIYFKNKNQ